MPAITFAWTGCSLVSLRNPLLNGSSNQRCESSVSLMSVGD